MIDRVRWRRAFRRLPPAKVPPAWDSRQDESVVDVLALFHEYKGSFVLTDAPYPAPLVEK